MSTTSELTFICVLMALSLIAAVCAWLIGLTSYVGVVYPDRIINKEILAMAQQAMSLLKELGMGLVVGVLVQKAVTSSAGNQPK